nr:MAG TPA: hypothetical protein [Caudoviricetes sp.]
MFIFKISSIYSIKIPLKSQIQPLVISLVFKFFKFVLLPVHKLIF